MTQHHEITQVGVRMIPFHGLIALASGMVWDHRFGLGMAEVPSSWRNVELELWSAGEAAYSPL